MPYQILSFEAGPVATNAYLLIDAESGGAVIIDAPLDSADSIAEAARDAGVMPSALILTHTHWDHTADVVPLKRHFPEMIIYVHPDDEYRLIDPMAHTIWELPFVIEGIKANAYLRDNDVFRLNSITFTVLHTPGHTEGGISLLDSENSLLFVGDTIFANGVGRTDLPGGSWETLLDSITNRLMSLPDETVFHPGHGPSSTIGNERNHINNY